MRTKKVKRVKFLKGEKLMIFLIIVFGFVILPAASVYTSALLSESNIELERITTKIENQTDTNESLSMQIDELASITNIQEVAEEKGLTYEYENILTIEE